jgi:formate hydrogenlyase subunit 6/NADH:ubiquinone oxidoreductase subunit I
MSHSVKIYDTCIRCTQCARACPTDVLEMLLYLRNRVCFSVMFIAGYVGFCDKICMVLKTGPDRPVQPVQPRTGVLSGSVL